MKAVQHITFPGIVFLAAEHDAGKYFFCRVIHSYMTKIIT
jgi:hypothetical protein